MPGASKTVLGLIIHNLAQFHVVFLVRLPYYCLAIQYLWCKTRNFNVKVGVGEGKTFIGVMDMYTENKSVYSLITNM